MISYGEQEGEVSYSLCLGAVLRAGASSAFVAVLSTWNILFSVFILLLALIYFRGERTEAKKSKKIVKRG